MAASAGVGLFTGLLANGGRFLLVPMYLLIFGLQMREAAGTSFLVIAALAVPTLATRWALGHVDWGRRRRLRAGCDTDEHRERSVGAARGRSGTVDGQRPAQPLAVARSRAPLARVHWRENQDLRLTFVVSWA